MSEKNRVWMILGLVLLVGACLRLNGLDARELGNDEAFSWRMSQYPVPELLQRLDTDASPPLHYLVLKAWIALFGASPWSLRAMSVPLGCLAIAVMYLFVMELGRFRAARGVVDPRWRSAALCVAFLIAVSPFQIYHGRTVRGYALANAFAALSAWLVLAALNRPRRSGAWWLGYALAATAFAYTHYYACFTLAAEALIIGYAVLRTPEPPGETRWDRLKGPALALVIIGVLYSPWLPTLARQALSVHKGFWIPPVSWRQLSEVGLAYFIGLRDADALVVSLAWLTGGVVLLSLLWGRRPELLFVLLLMAAPWIGGIWLSVGGGTSVVLERYFLFSNLFYLAAVGVLLFRIRSTQLWAYASVLLIYYFGLGLAQDPELWRPQPRNLTMLVRDLGAQYQPGQSVLVGNAGQADQVLYAAARTGLCIRCQVVGHQVTGAGHQTHAASIRDDEWFPPEELGMLQDRHIWAIGNDKPPIPAPAGWRVAACSCFLDSGDSPWILMEFDAHLDPDER